MSLNKDLINKLQIPGKTFLVGEYAVLCGGASLSLATKPCFSVNKKVSSNDQNFHPLSAAGRLLNGHLLDVTLSNPYQTGGFGQSTAEYILAWIYQYGWPTDAKVVFDDYLKLYDQHLSQRPSGADLMTQLIGGVCYFKNKVTQRCDWVFEQLGFLVVSTGLKVPTHEHLETLDRGVLTALIDYADPVIESYFKKDQNQFLNTLKKWSKQLEIRGLQSEQVLDLKQKIESCSHVLLVKPCGALGADVALVFYDKADVMSKKGVVDHLTSLNLRIQADENQLATGVIS